jgi:hypothetical protein
MAYRAKGTGFNHGLALVVDIGGRRIMLKRQLIVFKQDFYYSPAIKVYEISRRARQMSQIVFLA